MSESIKLPIKKVYKGENLNYFVGIIETHNLYVMEVTDTTGFIMGVPGQTDAQNPAKALFGITKEEFELKDKDTAKLDDLAFELMHKIPKDRILAETNLREDCREESIDGGKYASEQTANLEKKKTEIVAESKKRAEKLINEMKQKGEAWYIYTVGAGNKLPTIDAHGAVQIFSSEENARLAVEKASGVSLEIQKMDKEFFNAFLVNLSRFGVLKIKVDLFQPDGGEIMRDDICPLGNLREYQLLNSACYSIMIRYMQAKKLLDGETASITSATLWSYLCKEFPKSLFFVPVTFEDEKNNVKDDLKLYFTQNGAKALKEKKPAILGIEKYKPSDSNGKKMIFMTLNHSSAGENRIFLPLFTDISELKAVFKDNAKLCVVAYQDILEIYKKFAGIVINPASLSLVITDKGIESIDKEKDGPVKIYKLDRDAKKTDGGSANNQ